MQHGWWLVVLGIGCTGPGADDGLPEDTADTEDTQDTEDTDQPETPTTGTSPARVTGILNLGADVAAGEAVYLDNCRVCHGLDGQGSLSGPALTDRLPLLSDREIVLTILEGRIGMTAFAALENQEIADVFFYVTTNFQ